LIWVLPDLSHVTTIRVCGQQAVAIPGDITMLLLYAVVPLATLLLCFWQLMCGMTCMDAGCRHVACSSLSTCSAAALMQHDEAQKQQAPQVGSNT
jgi:hypothetical protein